MANENKKMNEFPVSTTITSLSKVLGLNDTNATVLFTLSQLRTNNIGQFKTTDATPPTPLLNSNYELVGTAVGNTPSGTYTNLLGVGGTPIVIPAAAAGHGILNAKAVWNGTYWVPVWQDILLPTVDLSNYATLGNLALKVSFTDIYSKNLVNVNAAGVVIGKFLAGSGVLTTSATYNTTDFISVIAGQQISCNAGIRFIEYYTAKNMANYLGSVVAITPPATTTNTVPATAIYARYTFQAAVWPNVQVEVAASPTSLVNWGIDTSNLQDQGITAVKIKDANVTQPKLSFLTPTVNLLFQNAPGVQLGKFLGGSGTLTTGAYNTSDFIPVTQGTQFTGSAGIRFVEYYTAANMANYLGALVSITTGLASTQTVPTGAIYMKVSFSTATWALSMVNTGASILPYVKAGATFDYSINVVSTPAPTSLNWTSEGDSITAGVNGLYQTKAATALSLIVTNTGVGGTKMGGSDANSMWQDARVNLIPTTTNVLTILCGTNDWAQNEVIGTVSKANVTTTEFIGALNVWLGKIYTRILSTTPTLQIFVLTTTVGYRNTPYPTPWGADGYTNSLGWTTSDYAEALRQWAKMWNLKVVDVNSSWNPLNINGYVPSADGLHPNVTGLDQMSMEIIDRLKNRIRFN